MGPIPTSLKLFDSGHTPEIICKCNTPTIGDHMHAVILLFFSSQQNIDTAYIIGAARIMLLDC